MKYLRVTYRMPDRNKRHHSILHKYEYFSKLYNSDFAIRLKNSADLFSELDFFINSSQNNISTL